MGDDWWAKEKQVGLLLKLAGKGDRRALKKAGRKLDELKTELEVERIGIAYLAALQLKAYVDRPRTVPTFRRSYGFEFFCESLAVGRRMAVA